MGDTRTMKFPGLPKRVRDARVRKRYSKADIARRLGITRSAVAQWESGIAEPNSENMRNLARILGVPVEWLQTERGPATISDETTPLEPMAEGEQINISELGADLARPVIAATSGRAAEVWRLKADKMAGAGYRPGDYLVVDLSISAKPRDVVLADIAGVPVFRMLMPPYLFALPVGAVEPAIVADNIRVIVRGVVVSRFSFS